MGLDAQKVGSWTVFEPMVYLNYILISGPLKRFEHHICTEKAFVEEIDKITLFIRQTLLRTLA